ncbi:MAG: cytochrome c oxidase subunit [Bryobacterales bacterium]|jgi:cytochrome c oxidase subunit 3/cytochrome o ubiquinol oxidase subunit 3|nr:cytochrome c oxidase subunit [Bryobacterales bacterium]
MAYTASPPLDATTAATEWKPPDRGTVGIASFIVAETALFAIFVAAYLFYLGKSLNGPYPRDVLTVPVTATICLLSSSGTIVMAERALQRHQTGPFRLWWMLTTALAAIFLVMTGMEWWKLIRHDHLTVSTNCFGSTYYGLVGLHASHVIVGLFFLTLVLLVSFRGFPITTQERRIKLLSWYWHFVDAVWVVVFTVVYVIGR